MSNNLDQLRENIKTLVNDQVRIINLKGYLHDDYLIKRIHDAVEFLHKSEKSQGCA